MRYIDEPVDFLDVERRKRVMKAEGVDIPVVSIGPCRYKRLRREVKRARKDQRGRFQFVHRLLKREDHGVYRSSS